MPRPAALYNRRKWQLIDKSQWCCSANCGHPFHAVTYNWTRCMQLPNTPPLQSTTPGLHPVSFHQMAPPVQGNTQTHIRLQLTTQFIDLERMKGWVDLVGWLNTEIQWRLRESNPDTSPIPVLRASFQKASPSVHAGPVRVYEPRTSALLTVRRHGLHDLIRVGLFNARSVSKKSASIQHWIASTGLNVAALVETWHDDAARPDLIACAPPGFKLVEAARARKHHHCSLSTNHGGVCVLYDRSLHARTVELPVFPTFEVVAAVSYTHLTLPTILRV